MRWTDSSRSSHCIPMAHSNSTHRRALSLLLHQTRLTLSHLHQLHSHLAVSGGLSGHLSTGKLIAHYCLTSLPHAQTLLHHTPRRSPSLWNTVIRALSDSHNPRPAIWAFRHMVRSRFSPDNYTFSFVLRSCAEVSDMGLVLMCHGLVVKLGWEEYDYVRNGLVHCYASCGCMEFARELFDRDCKRDVVTWTALINGYVRIGEMRVARVVFDEMPEKNAVSWSSMVNGYVRMGMFVEAMETFKEMLVDRIRPNHSCLVGALSACSYLCALAQGSWIHAYVCKNDMELDLALGTALIDMYAKCGCIDIARDVFETIPYRDVFAYTSLIFGLADNGQSVTALEFFRRMEEEGIRPNEVTFICVLSACSKIGLVEEGLKIFGRMKDVYGILLGVKHYGCLVDLLGRAGLVEEAYEVVRKMPMEPDAYVLGALLNGCRVHGDVDMGKMMVDGFKETSSVDHSGVQVLVSNIYASLSKWKDVERVREGMMENKVKKVTGCSLLEV